MTTLHGQKATLLLTIVWWYFCGVTGEYISSSDSYSTLPNNYLPYVYTKNSTKPTISNSSPNYITTDITYPNSLSNDEVYYYPIYPQPQPSYSVKNTPSEYQDGISSTNSFGESSGSKSNKYKSIQDSTKEYLPAPQGDQRKGYEGYGYDTGHHYTNGHGWGWGSDGVTAVGATGFSGLSGLIGLLGLTGWIPSAKIIKIVLITLPILLVIKLIVGLVALLFIPIPVVVVPGRSSPQYQLDFSSKDYSFRIWDILKTIPDFANDAFEKEQCFQRMSCEVSRMRRESSLVNSWMTKIQKILPQEYQEIFASKILQGAEDDSGRSVETCALHICNIKELITKHIRRLITAKTKKS